MTQPERPRRTLDRALDVTEALLWLALLAFGTQVALVALRDEPAAPSGPAAAAPVGLIEAETLPVRATSRKFTFWLQPTEGFRGGRWSKDGHMFAYGTREGDWVELELPPREQGEYRLEMFLTKAADYGILAASVNGDRVGDPIDLWSYGVLPSGAVDLGLVSLRGQGDVLRLQLIGTNPNATAPFYQFGVDGIRLTRSP